MLQLIVVYYGPGLIFGQGAGLNAYLSTFITFGINYACYFSEIPAAEILEVIQVEALEAASLEIILQEYLPTRLTKI